MRSPSPDLSRASVLLPRYWMHAPFDDVIVVPSLLTQRPLV